MAAARWVNVIGKRRQHLNTIGIKAERHAKDDTAKIPDQLVKLPPTSTNNLKRAKLIAC